MLRGSAKLLASLAMRSWALPATSGAASAAVPPTRLISVLPSLRLFQARRKRPQNRTPDPCPPCAALTPCACPTHHLTSGTLVSVSAVSSLSPADGLSKSDDVAYAIHAACAALGQEPDNALIRQLKAADFTTAQELASMTPAEARLLGVPLQLSLAVADLLEGRPAGPGGAEAVVASGEAPALAAPAAAAAVVAAPTASRKNKQPKETAGKTHSLPQQAVELLKSTLGLGQAAAAAPAAAAAAAVEAPAAAAPAEVPALAAAAVAAATSDEEEEEEEEEVDSLELSDADLSAEDDLGEAPHANNVVPAAAVSGWNADVPIEERVCPPLNRFHHTAADARNVSKRQGRPARYAVRVRSCRWAGWHRGGQALRSRCPCSWQLLFSTTS